MAKAAVNLRAKLANVFIWKTVDHGEARELLHEAIDILGDHDPLQAARLQNLLGRFEIENHDYARALAAFDAAVAQFGDRPQDQDEAVVALWLEIQLEGRALMHYFGNEPVRLMAVLADVSPVVEARGGPAQKQYLLTALLRGKLLQARNRVDEDIIATARAALAAAEEGCGGWHEVVEGTAAGGRDLEVGWKLYDLARCLVLHGDLDEAEEKLNATLATADRVHEAVLRLRCLSLLVLTALRRHDVVTVAALVPRALEAGAPAQWPEYEAMAMASLAWLAWCEGHSEEVEPRAEEALALWASTTGWQPVHWICLWPLIAVRLAARQVRGALDASRQLLEPSQQRLPDELEAMVEAARRAWESGDADLAGATLAGAVELAERLRYL